MLRNGQEAFLPVLHFRPRTDAPPAMSTALPAPRTVAPAPWLWWGSLAVAAGLVLALFGPTFLLLVRLWDVDQNYSHGYLVAPLSLVFAWRIYRKVGPPVRGELALGLLDISFGIACQLAAGAVRWPPLSYLGLIAVLRGLLVVAGGRKWAASFNFPLLFLFFMFPLPVTWTSYAALWLQDVVARISETVISLFVVCHRVGHTIRIAGVDQSLVVAEECSGLGQIIAFLAFAALLGELFARPAWYRIVLLVAAVPLAIAANTLRVVLMNFGAYWFGTKWMAGSLHDTPALFSIPVGIVLFLLLDRVLAGFTETRSAERGTENGEPSTQEPAAADGQAKPEAESASAPPAPPSTPAPGRRLLWAVGVLAVGVAAQFALGAHLHQAGEASYPPLVGRFESMHKEADGKIVIRNPETGMEVWVGQEMDEAREKTREKLTFQVDDLLMRFYARLDNRAVGQLYMVYSPAGEDRKHHPEICIRDVGGAPEDVAFRREVPLDADGTAHATRFRFRTGAGRSLVVYYWHYTPRPNPVPGQTALQTIHQRVGISAPSVTAQLTVPGDDPAAVEMVEQQLLPAIHREAIQKVLPPGTDTGCNRVPIGLSRQ
jgi:exosortase